MASDLLDRRFLAVIGKGGTGKTTVTAALAILAASRGKRVLVAMSQARERMSSMLESQFITSEVAQILPNIDAVNLDPEACLDEYGMMILKVRALYKAVMDNRAVKGFLRAVPGMDAWSMLGKTLYHVKQQENGRPVYDLVLLDAPATGHGLQMLRVPQVITKVAPIGLLRREAEEGLAIMRDPRQSGMVVVTLAEEMPTTETEELIPKLTQELQLPLAKLVINQVLTPLFKTGVEPARAAAEVLARASALEGVARVGLSRARREALQRTMIERLAKLPGSKVMLPALTVEQVRRADIEMLARGLGSV
ncbi:MAG: anion-transporting ATPase [Deltaproteobacteria bacterium]|nr:anion-transporting ATPase [Deltaproteobacteria bacterium]